ncbi:MAG: succinylglutamate-semialdehyde dehydrogenase [Polyangiaceae bacterium]|nr:succinylglutamate-semialdehyde dehydrogenase [Polyangiaceae bacterium]
MNCRGDLFIAGTWRRGDGDPMSSEEPASGVGLWQGNSASRTDVADALHAARAAFRSWSRAPIAERTDVVRSFRDRIAARRQELGELIARETGKPRWEAETEALAMAAKVDISVDAYAARTGCVVRHTAFGRAVLRHRPHGVMVVLGPYNFPGHLPNGHIVPALVAGDTVVFKPSELTPAVGEAMVELWQEAGAPAGVVSLVQGGPSVGAALLEDTAVGGVLFTGSAATGSAIHRALAGRTDVILALEMGGNNPLVVWEPEATEAAADLVVQSAYLTTGQRCSCARRLIVPFGAAGDRIVAATAARARSARIGAWDEEPPPFMGPLISAHAANKVLAAHDRLVAKGAEPVLACRRIVGRSQAFVTPGLLEMHAVRAPDEEVFGPLLAVYRARDFTHALELANDTRFGLAAGLIADEPALWSLFVEEARAGVVNWNRPTTGAASTLPFGGPGRSGNHRPSAWYAADYCAYPVASQEATAVNADVLPGLEAKPAAP